MATNLSVMFNMVDNISNKLGAIAASGHVAESSFQSIENSANQIFESIESGSDAISQSFERTSSAAVSLASNVGAYSGETVNAASSVETLIDAEGSAETSFRETADAVDEAAEGLGEFGEQAETAGESAEEFGEKSANAMADLNSLLVSGGIIAAIHAVADGFAECASQAEVVETAVAQLQTIAGGDSIDSLRDDIIALSNDTGQAAEGLADTAYNAISAGTAVEESVEMAESASKLAAAGFADVSSSLSVVETAMNSYGDAAGSAAHVSDSLITVQNLGVTTVAQLAAQMGKGISTASAYNVSLENLESGYISITKAGINTAEGTTYIASMLNELGNAGSKVSKILRDETGNTFGELMKEGESLADVLGIIYDACDNNAEAMMNMWGSAEAGKAANAIIGQGLDTFNQNLDTLQTSVGTTEEAYKIMAGTTEYAHNKMDNAAKNTSMQIGDVLNPTLTKLYAQMEKVYTGVGQFVSENPVVVKAIAAITAGVATFAGGIATYTATTTVATAVQTAFNGAMLSSPVFWVAGGVAALTTGLVFLASAYEDATDSTNELTYASEEQGKELERLRREYDDVCESEGSNSEQASELAAQIYELEQAYGESGETVGQFRERIDELGKSLEETYQSYTDNVKSADDMYGSANILIGELQALQNQTHLTDAELAIMKSIVGELNGSYADLGLTINEQTGKLNYSTSDLFDYAKAQKEQQEIEAASQGLVEALGKYEEARSEYESAGTEVDVSWDKFEDTKQNWIEEHPVLSKIGKGAEVNWSSDVGKSFDHWEQAQAAYQSAADNMNKLKGNIEEYCKTLGYTDEEIDKFVSSLEDGSIEAEESATKFGESGEELVTYSDAVEGAVDSVSVELEQLSSAYDEAYNKAFESIEGQYSLWDKVENKSKTSVDKINQAMQSQIDYWNDYADNLSNLQGRDIDGLSDVLKNMDDGSEESAAALASMANATDAELQKMVKQYEKLQDAQGKTAKEVADLEEGFGQAMTDMENDLKDSVEKMNMEEEARTSAQKTIQAYINAIRSGINGAQSAATAVANATASALNSASNTQPSFAPTTPQLQLPGHAEGTTDSERVYVAGEEGPEIILSGGGDTVFPASETERIISAVSGSDDNRQITNPSVMSYSSTEKGEIETASGGERTITLRLEGSGAIGIGSGTSKEDVWNNMKENIKSTFMQLLQEEVFEEGAGAYEF